MFIVREDIDRKRDLKDRLKIAFAVAAQAGLGFGWAYLIGGKNGAVTYGVVAALSFFPLNFRNTEQLCIKEFDLHPADSHSKCNGF